MVYKCITLTAFLQVNTIKVSVDKYNPFHWLTLRAKAYSSYFIGSFISLLCQCTFILLNITVFKQKNNKDIITLY